MTTEHIIMQYYAHSDYFASLFFCTQWGLHSPEVSTEKLWDSCSRNFAGL